MVRWSTVDPADDVISKVFADNPGCNVGLRLDQFVVVDCDSPERVAWWVEQGFETPFQSRGNPERRSFWYRLPEDVEIRTKPFSGWEIRSGCGSQCVVPPSTHPDGWKYVWLGPPVDEEHFSEIPEAPVAFLEMFKHERAPLINNGQGWDVMEEGGRDNLLIGAAGFLRARGFSVAAVRHGIALFNELFCEPRLTSADLDRIARSSGRWEADLNLIMEDEGGLTIQSPKLLASGSNGLGMPPPNLLK